MSLIAADLLGRSHVVQHAKRVGEPIPSEKFADPFASIGGVPQLKPNEAIEFFRNKVPLDSKTIERLVRLGKTRSETARKQILDQLREVVDQAIVDGLAEGWGIDRFLKEFDSIMERAGFGKTAPHRVETIFRTNNTLATTAGRLQQLDDPDVSEVFTHLQYNAILDSRVRPEHAAMNGKVYPRDHAIWKTWLPPNGFNCRCSVTPVSGDDIKSENLTRSRAAPKIDGNAVQPDKGFRNANARSLARNAEAGL